MDAWIAFSLCSAVLAAGPAINRPRPKSAPPTLSVVHAEAWQTGERPLIPPSPLPEFDWPKLPQVSLEGVWLESCSDSYDCLPAPPAELDLAESAGVEIELSGHTFFQIPWQRIELQPASACDEIEACPAELMMTTDQLKHLEQAIQHLESAGLHEDAQKLRAQHQTAQAKFRDQQRRQLETKQAELKRLTEEVERLKAELSEDQHAHGEPVQLLFQVEHFRFDPNVLQSLADGAPNEVQEAAQIVLQQEAAVSAAVMEPAALEPFRTALQILRDNRHVQLVARPQIRTLENQTGQVLQGQIVPVVNGVTISRTGLANPNVQLQEAGVILTVTPRISPDGQIVMDLTAEKSAYQLNNGVPIFTDAATGNVITAPVKDIASVRAVLSVPSGQTVVIRGFKSTRSSRDADGKSEKKEESDIILITPLVIEPGLIQETNAATRIEPGLQAAPQISTAPNRNVINPQFYVGEVPSQVLQRWRQAFSTTASAEPDVFQPLSGIAPVAPPTADASPALPQQQITGPRFHILQMQLPDATDRVIWRPAPLDTDPKMIVPAPPPNPRLRFPVPQPVPTPSAPPANPDFIVPPAPLPADGDVNEPEAEPVA